MCALLLGGAVSVAQVCVLDVRLARLTGMVSVCGGCVPGPPSLSAGAANIFQFPAHRWLPPLDQSMNNAATHLCGVLKTAASERLPSCSWWNVLAPCPSWKQGAL